MTTDPQHRPRTVATCLTGLVLAVLLAGCSAFAGEAPVAEEQPAARASQRRGRPLARAAYLDARGGLCWRFVKDMTDANARIDQGGNIPLEEQVRGTRQIADVWRRFQDDTRQLSPPRRIAEHHDEMDRILTEIVGRFDTAVEEVARNSHTGMQAALADVPALTAEYERSAAAAGVGSRDCGW